MATSTLSPAAQCQAEYSENPACKTQALLSSSVSEQQLLVLSARYLNIQSDVLVDSGASHKYISQEFLESLRRLK